MTLFNCLHLPSPPPSPNPFVDPTCCSIQLNSHVPNLSLVNADPLSCLPVVCPLRTFPLCLSIKAWARWPSLPCTHVAYPLLDWLCACSSFMVPPYSSQVCTTAYKSLQCLSLYFHSKCCSTAHFRRYPSDQHATCKQKIKSSQAYMSECTDDICTACPMHGKSRCLGIYSLRQ